MNKKLALAKEFLDEGLEQLKKYEDTKKETYLRQACEKGWGSVAQALKAVNPNIKKHMDFGKTATKLAEEYNNEELFHLEALGEHLHRAGFYEGLLDAREIRHALHGIANFLNLIDNILSNEGGKKEIIK